MGNDEGDQEQSERTSESEDSDDGSRFRTYSSLFGDNHRRHDAYWDELVNDMLGLQDEFEGRKSRGDFTATVPLGRCVLGDMEDV